MAKKPNHFIRFLGYVHINRLISDIRLDQNFVGNALTNTWMDATEDAMERLIRGRTTFIIAHRLSTVVKTDKILVVHQGSIVESGTLRRAVRTDFRCEQDVNPVLRQ